jgi:hypothetical protein
LEMDVLRFEWCWEDLRNDQIICYGARNVPYNYRGHFAVEFGKPKVVLVFFFDNEAICTKGWPMVVSNRPSIVFESLKELR